MEKLTSIKIDQVTTDLKNAINEVLAKHNLVMSKGLSSSYTEKFSNMKFQYSLAGEKHANAAFNFKNYHFRYGMEISDLGKKFKHQGKEYTLVGSRTKARKAPLQIEDANGQIFNAPVDVVKFALKQA